MCELQFPAYEYNDSVKNWKKWQRKRREKIEAQLKPKRTAQQYETGLV